jgi:hypothetical protein
MDTPSSVIPDKSRDRTLNHATNASLHTVASDTVQSETANGAIAEQTQTITTWSMILLTKTKTSQLLNTSPAFCGTPIVHYRVYNSLIRSQSNQIYDVLSCLRSILILPLHLRPRPSPGLFRVPNQNSVYLSCPPSFMPYVPPISCFLTRIF